MQKIALLAILALSYFSASSQNTLKPLEQLIDTLDPGWPIVQKLIAEAKNKVEVLPRDTAQANSALYHSQMTTRSYIGAILYMTGGILVDNGWIRILGSGSGRQPRNLTDWNKGKTFEEYGQQPAYILIADDVLGGFYAFNFGGLGKDVGQVYYLAPDRLEWEPMDMKYRDFLVFCFSGDLGQYYKGYRWKEWKEEVAALSGDQAYHIVPPLWSKEGKDINKDLRKAVPIEELYHYTLALQNQLHGRK